MDGPATGGRVSQRHKPRIPDFAAIKKQVEILTFMLQTNVNHRCPSCGKPKWNRIGAGWVQCQTRCQACGAEYTLTREMHVMGLAYRERQKKKAGKGKAQ